MRESTAAKKTIHSGEQAAFASRQLDNTHRVKVERGREAASPLRRREGGGAFQQTQQTPKQPEDSSPYTHTCTHTAVTPPPPQLQRANDLAEGNKQTRRPTRETSIPTFYSLLLITASVDPT